MKIINTNNIEPTFLKNKIIEFKKYQLILKYQNDEIKDYLDNIIDHLNDEYIDIIMNELERKFNIYTNNLYFRIENILKKQKKEIIKTIEKNTIEPDF